MFSFLSDALSALVSAYLLAWFLGPSITRSITARGWGGVGESEHKSDGRTIFRYAYFANDLLWIFPLRHLFFSGRELGVRDSDWMPFFGISTLIMYVSLVISSKIVLKQPFSKTYKVWILWAFAMVIVKVILLILWWAWWEW